jgi:acyl dehydratase
MGSSRVDQAGLAAAVIIVSLGPDRQPAGAGNGASNNGLSFRCRAGWALSAVPQRFLDDFKLGEVFTSCSHVLSEKYFTAFADMTGDAHPLHYDADYARGRGWDGPIAHGLMLLGLCAFGAAPISEEVTESMVAMLGNDVRYRRPAITGDTVTPRFTVLSVEAKDDSCGIVRLGITLHNQRNELVLEGTHILMLRRRATPR